jgi:hypothetical protein
MWRIWLAVGLTLSLALAPLAATTGEGLPIGVLHPRDFATASTEAFRQGLRDFGYVEGQTLVALAVLMQ